MTDDLPQLPGWATDAHRERHAAIASLARRVADRLPHEADEFAETAHGLDLHVRPRPEAGARDAEAASLPPSS